MKILLLSNSFTTKDSLDHLFKDVFESVIIVQSSSLTNNSVIELINYDFIFIEIDEDMRKDISLLWKVKSISTNLRVMILDREKCGETFKEAVSNCIEGYIYSVSDKSEFIYNLKRVMDGKRVYEDDLIHFMINEEKPCELQGLTNREKEVLAELAKGLDNKSIANSLHITDYTVKKHVSSILSKLNLKNRQEAIIYANKF